MLLDHLGVKRLKMAIGGSMGCMLALEWGATYPEYVDSLCLMRDAAGTRTGPSA